VHIRNEVLRRFAQALHNRTRVLAEQSAEARTRACAALDNIALRRRRAALSEAGRCSFASRSHARTT
jgi:hypothetical protein